MDNKQVLPGFAEKIIKKTRRCVKGANRKLSASVSNTWMNPCYQHLVKLIRCGAVASKYKKMVWIKYGEMLWMNPVDCKRILPFKHLYKTYGYSLKQSKAKIVHSSWPVKYAVPVHKVKAVRFCIDHWVHGVPWEQTGEYKRIKKQIRRSKKGVAFGCKNKDDIERRCRNLDRIFEQAKQEGRLRRPDEISPEYYWGNTAIMIHIGSDGEIFQGGGGTHRFAIAHILNVPFPAQIGLVHADATTYLKKIDQT